MYLLYLLFLVDLKRKEFNKDALNQIKLLIFPDGCCTRFDLILCRFKSINESIFKLMIFIESGTLLKNHNSCNFPLKYYVKNFISTSCKNFNQPFYRSNKKKEMATCMLVLFGQLNEAKEC